MRQPRELLALDDLLYIDPGVSGAEEQELRQELQDYVRSPGNLEQRVNDLHYTLGLMHEARLKDEYAFLHDAFLPWVALTQQTQFGIGDMVAKLATAMAAQNSSKKIQASLDLYRDLIASLFDPYVTIFVASYQFLEGSFDGIEAANLGIGERNKTEFVLSRVKRSRQGWNMFKDYDPIVRNAITHTGSHGVTIEESTVLFRDIRRSDRKVETRRWTFEEVISHTFDLLECLRSIEIASNVFGYDCGSLLTSDYNGVAALANFAFSPDQRSELRTTFEEGIATLRHNENLDQDERLKRLTDIFLKNCEMRGMDVGRIKVDESKSIGKPDILKILAPSGGPDGRSHVSGNPDLSTAISLVRYAIVGRSVYGELFDPYVVCTEPGSDSVSHVIVVVEGKLLDEYADEKAGLLDILHESPLWIDGERAKIEVDFEAVQQQEDVSLGVQRFPRRSR